MGITQARDRELSTDPGCQKHIRVFLKLHHLCYTTVVSLIILIWFLRNFEQTFLLVLIRSGSLAKRVQKYSTFRNWSRKTICFYLVLMEDLFQKFSSPQSAFGFRNVNYTPIDKFFLFVFHTYGQSREQFAIKYTPNLD